MRQSYKRRRWFLLQCVLGTCILALLLSACSLPGTSSSSATPTSTTGNPGSGSTPTVAASPTPATPVANQPTGTGSLPPGQSLPSGDVKSLIFNLAYKDSAMEQDIIQMYTPGSSSYHHFLTSDEIVQRYALQQDQVKAVQDWLTQSGYSIVDTSSLLSFIKVEGTVATIEHSLNIRLQSFTVLGQQFFMQTGNPQLPSSIAPYVQSIVGLNNFAVPQFKPPFGSIARGSTGAVAGDCAKYGAKNTLTRDKLAGAYQINKLYQQGIQGQGMTIGVAEFGDPYDPQDVANYAACVGIPTPKIQNVDVIGHLASGTGQGEATMDLELIAGLAPQAQIIDYQTNTNSVSFAEQMVDVFNHVATDHQVQVLSVSYGSSEDSFSTSEQGAVNRSLRNLAAEGISIFVASGDCGAFDRNLLNIAQVDFPASSPYAIAVGGTHLLVNGSNVATGETGWGQDDGLPVCTNSWGSGGGVSQNTDFKRPSWQVGTGISTHYDGTAAHVVISPFTQQPVVAPNGLRQVPDVAAAAYPNIAIYYQGAWIASGGTSAAAPIWAVGTLLVDQGLQKNNKSGVGGVPELYSLANRGGSLKPYTDITSGNNRFYQDTVGWDYVTGWGSPNFNNILQIELA